MTVNPVAPPLLESLNIDQLDGHSKEDMERNFVHVMVRETYAYIGVQVQIETW